MQEQNLWEGLQETFHEDNIAIAVGSEPCYHLLCYMLCLSAIVKAATGPSRELQTELATHIWAVLLKNTGTPLSPKQIKFLPKQGFFKPLMTCSSHILSNILAGLASWGLNKMSGWCSRKKEPVNSDKRP